MSTPCIKCGNPNPEHTMRFAVVNVSSTSTTTYQGRKQITTTTTNESMAGVDKCCVCESCIRKKRIGHSIGTAIATFLAVYFFYIIFAAFFTNKKYFNSHVPGIFKVGALLSAVVAIIVFIVLMQTETPLIGAMILKKKRGKDGKGKVFAPIEPSIYTGKGSTQPNITAFMTKTGLKTQVANGIFFKFIASGTGSQLVDQMLFEQQRTTPNDITHDNTVQ